MDVQMFPLMCALCGKTGMGAVRSSMSAWAPDERFIHIDPNVCAKNLVLT